MSLPRQAAGDANAGGDLPEVAADGGGEVRAVPVVTTPTTRRWVGLVQLPAPVTEAPDLHLESLLAEGARESAGSPDGNCVLGQARHCSAVVTDEMRVFGLSVGAGCRSQFEAPDMVAPVSPTQEAGVGQIDQIAVDGGAVKRGMCKLVSHLCMR